MYKRILIAIFIIVLILNIGLYLLAQEEMSEPTRLAMGLTVEPGGMLVQYVPLGVTYDFYESVGIPLTIYNRDVSPHTYILSTDKPSTVAAKNWLRGYLEIPEPSWFWLEKDEVTIEANSKQQVKMYLKIPDKERYYNQHWTVALGIKGKSEPGQMLALAVYPRVQIETLAKSDVKERPDGIIGLTPSILSLDNLALGKTEKLKVRIYNNDTRRHRYRIESRVFPVDTTKELITTSPGYRWIPNSRWIKPQKNSVVIGSEGVQELTVSVNVPKNKENYNRKYEGVLFIEPPEGLPGFVRVQVMTERMAQ